MKDRRKIFFCLICIVFVVSFEFTLFKRVKIFDADYKDRLEKKLSVAVKELEERQFEAKTDYKTGKLEYERNKDGYEYGYICIDYDLDCELNDINLKLIYSGDLYIDDIIYDAYHIFDLLELDIENDYDFENDLADNFELNDDIIINGKVFNKDIKKTEDGKILFEIK